MKRKIAGLLAALMVLSVGTTVFAAPSNEAKDPVVAAVASDNKDAGSVTKVEAPADSVVTDMAVKAADAKVVTDVKDTQLKKFFDDKYDVAKIEVLGIFDLDVTTVGAIPAAGVDITFSVTGIKATDNVAVLHQKKDSTWENLTAKAGNGTVTANFKSFSPVAIVKLPEAKTSDKTGSTAPVMAVLAMICLAGVVVCGKKVKFNA